MAKGRGRQGEHVDVVVGALRRVSSVSTEKGGSKKKNGGREREVSKRESNIE